MSKVLIDGRPKPEGKPKVMLGAHGKVVLVAHAEGCNCCAGDTDDDGGGGGDNGSCPAAQYPHQYNYWDFENCWGIPVSSRVWCFDCGWQGRNLRAYSQGSNWTEFDIHVGTILPYQDVSPNPGTTYHLSCQHRFPGMQVLIVWWPHEWTTKSKDTIWWGPSYGLGGYPWTSSTTFDVQTRRNGETDLILDGAVVYTRDQPFLPWADCETFDSCGTLLMTRSTNVSGLPVYYGDLPSGHFSYN